MGNLRASLPATRYVLRHEVLERAVAARLCLCCLYEGVDALDEAVGDAAVEPGKDTVAMAH